MSLPVIFKPAAGLEFDGAVAWHFPIKDDSFAILSVFHTSRDPAELETRLK